MVTGYISFNPDPNLMRLRDPRWEEDVYEIEAASKNYVLSRFPPSDLDATRFKSQFCHLRLDSCDGLTQLYEPQSPAM